MRKEGLEIGGKSETGSVNDASLVRYCWDLADSCCTAVEKP